MESRIVRKIDAMHRLQHHMNILKIYEVMATKTKIYFVVEFTADASLIVTFLESQPQPHSVNTRTSLFVLIAPYRLKL